MHRVLITCLFCLFLSGCGSPISKSNYDRIETGMSISEVQGILGKGSEQASSDASFGGISMNAKQMTWQDGNRIITVTFMNDKVQGKAQMGL
jgi:hypothetical protein